MSFAEDNGYDAYDPPEDTWEDDRFFVLKNGKKVCSTCGSQNIKTSAKGNDYCADLCWVESDVNQPKQESRL